MPNQPLIKYGLIGIALAALICIGFQLTGTPFHALKDVAMVLVAVITTIGARSQVFTAPAAEKLVVKALNELPPANPEAKAAEMVAVAKDTK